MREPVMVTPFDEFNQTLVDNVAPADWPSPEPAPVYHLVVLGAGTAGLVAAAAAAGLGARVALVERHLMGGDCLVTGCVPSKALLRTARAWKEAAGAGAFGVRGEALPGDFGAAMKRVRERRAALSPHDSAARFRDLGVDVFFGHGRFVGPREIAVDGRKLRFHRALIATGGRPALPELAGLEEAGYLTSETAFTLMRLPARLAVIGGGPLGCELAQAFARFGAQVTMFLRERHLLPREEPEAAAVVRRALEADGIRIVDRAACGAVERGPRAKSLRYQVDGVEHRLAVDEILIAVGRRPNVEDLGLESCGVVARDDGVAVDDHLRTANPAVYAAGDVCSAFRFTHAAEAMARLVVRNALFGGGRRASRLIIPWCTYTSPEVARVGRSRIELEREGIRFETLTVPLAENDRARLDGAEEGFLLVHHRRGSDRILGATLVSEHAGESIGELVLALQERIGLARLADTIHPYPTQAEVLKRAGDAWNRRRLTPFTRRLLRFWFRRLERKALRQLAVAEPAKPAEPSKPAEPAGPAAP